MPFTEPADRRKMDKIKQLQAELHTLEVDVKPGDLCFYQYRRMMKEWKKQPRWTTVDTLLAPVFPDPEQRAYVLAFLVFFAFKALPYERQKQAENGDVTGED